MMSLLASHAAPVWRGPVVEVLWELFRGELVSPKRSLTELARLGKGARGAGPNVAPQEVAIRHSGGCPKRASDR